MGLAIPTRYYDHISIKNNVLSFQIDIWLEAVLLHRFRGGRNSSFLQYFIRLGIKFLKFVIQENLA